MIRLVTIPFFIFWIIFGVLWTAIALIVTVRSRWSKSWLQTIGTVVYSEVKSTESRSVSNDMLVDSTAYEPHIKYTYSVGGRECENDKFASAVTPGIRDPAGAEDILRGYPVGSQVAVFYNPLSPEDSVLVPGGSRGNVYFLLIGFVILAVGVIGLISQW